MEMQVKKMRKHFDECKQAVEEDSFSSQKQGLRHLICAMSWLGDLLYKICWDNEPIITEAARSVGASFRSIIYPALDYVNDPTKSKHKYICERFDMAEENLEHLEKKIEIHLG